MRYRLLVAAAVVLGACSAPAVDAAIDPTPLPTIAVDVSRLSDAAPVIAPVRAAKQAVRINPPTTTTTTLPPLPIPGDCDSWSAEFVRRGATAAEIAFFFDRGIIWRETRCGLDTLNERTGDSGICQVTPLHGRAGYFFGREYGPGGWIAQFGVAPRQNTDSPAWIDACLFLIRKGSYEPGTIWTTPWAATR